MHLGMAGKLMRAVQYEGYGGGAAGLKVFLIPLRQKFLLCNGNLVLCLFAGLIDSFIECESKFSWSAGV